MCVTGVNKRSGIDQKIQLLQTSFNFPRPTRHQLQKNFFLPINQLRC